MASEGDEGPLVGRSDTLADLESDLRNLGHGGTSAVFVTGESGVGKSRLLRETARAMNAAGVSVLSGTCLDIGDASPLHPVLQALRQGQPEQKQWDQTAGADALLEQVSRDLRGVAGDRHLLLVLDDLQWADRSTRQLLLYLLAGLGGIRVSVLAAVRAEALHGAHPLRRVLAELRRLRSVKVVDLAPLDREQTSELVDAIARGGVEPEDADRVYKRSGGNPFVVEELARDLRDGRVELSDTLREIFLSRVDELPPAAHAVVYAVAAGVEPVDHAVLARVTKLTDEELIEAVRAAMAHRFVASAPEGYRLRHRLVAEVLEAEVLPAEAASLHRRYAEAMEAAGIVDHARLAHHWQRAGEPARALPSVVAAARSAEKLYGFTEAHRYWSLALDLTTDDAPERTELLAHAAESAHMCGEHQRSLSNLAELAGRPDGPGECELHLRRARYLAASGRSATAEVEYELALESPGRTPQQRVSAAANLAELLLHLGRYADANARATEALDQAAVTGSTRDLVRASAALGFSAAFREDPDAGLAVIRHAVEIAERSGHPDDLGVAYLHLAELLTGPLNNIEEGVLVARRGAARLAQMGAGRTYQTRLLAIAGNGLFRVGQWAEADAVLEAAMAHRPSGADAVELLLARCRLWVGFGDVDAAHRDLDAVATLLAGGGARHVLPMLTLRAGLAMWQGQHAQARAAVRRGLTETRSDDLVLLGVLAWHGLRAEAEARAAGEPVDPGAVRRLRAVVERMAEGVGRAAGPVRAVIDGYIDLCNAEISRVEERHDPEPWVRAAVAWDRRNQPYPAAYARLRRAEAALTRKTRKAAAVLALREAYATATAMGARPLANEIVSTAQRFRVLLADDVGTVEMTAPGADPGDALDVLTQREREVLAAVAEGLTNREIGERLFISERTVGVHVGHIFDKLQVRTRVQASRVFLTAA